jgi:hypothetical protein
MCFKNKRLSGRAPALQAQSPEITSQSHQKKKKKEEEEEERTRTYK